MLRLDRRLHLARCAAALGLRRCEVRLVPVDELVSHVGYPRGCIGPIGARRSASVLLDAELAREAALFVGAGELGWEFPIGGPRLLEEANVSAAGISRSTEVQVAPAATAT